MQNKITFKNPRRFFRKMLMVIGLLCFITGAIKAQPYINGTLSTGTVVGGITAPAGTTWSEVPNPNENLGFGANISAGVTCADDFIVPGGVTWNVTKVTFYAYSTGYTGTTSPFNNTRVQIFNTDPSVGSPTPVFGNLTANVFSASTFADMYRIFTGTPGQTRKIWKIEATVNTSLPAGHYWMEWQHGTIASVTSNFSPSKTVAGTATQAGNNAKQHEVGTTTWEDIVEVGGPQDMPFQIDYTATGVPCTAEAPGATLTSLATACPGVPFILTVANPGGGLGISYQWQSSTDGTTFVDLVGATNSTLTNIQAVASWYRLKVTCGTNAALLSTPVKVDRPVACYCAAGASDTDPDLEKISNVKFGTLNNSSTSAIGYENFTALTPVSSFEIGTTHSIKITGSNTYDFDVVSVWIDWNQDGDFDDAGEKVFESELGEGPYLGNITIPATATVGNTRMRVRVTDFLGVIFGDEADAPCGINEFGQVEDYTINVAPCAPIVFTDSIADVTIECGRNAIFHATNSGTNPVYQWQYKTSAAGTWLPLTNGGLYSGATTSTLKLTNVSGNFSGYQYRAIASGFCSGLIFSDSATLTVKQAVPVITPTTAVICEGSIQQLSITNSTSAVSLINETFNTAVPLPTGWAQQNRSVPAGTNPTWFQGNPEVFESNSGAPNAYIAANFRSTAGNGTISNWLFTPTVSIKKGDTLTFFTRVPLDAATGAVEFADRLQVRLSTNDASTTVGTTATSVGDYTTLLLDINPDLTLQGYPSEWTKFTAIIPDVPANVTGRIAFRYFVNSGGPSGSNSSYVGVDDVVYQPANVTAQGVWTSTATGTIFTDALATVPYTGAPATSVYVKPTETTDYKVTFSTSTPCVSAEGKVTVSVGKPITGTSTVLDQSACVGSKAIFTSSGPTSGNLIQHQWKVSTNGGATFTNIAGATTNTLTLNNVTASMNGNLYKDSLYVTSCNSFLISSVAKLTVNAQPVLVITANPSSQLYPSKTTTLTVASSTPAPATGYVWTRNGIVVPNANTNTLVVNIDELGKYKVDVVDNNGCSAKVLDSITVTAQSTDTLFVYPSPSTGRFQIRYYNNNLNFQTEAPRVVNIYDAKGARVYSKPYPRTTPYARMDVDFTGYPKGIYSIELLDNHGDRIKTGRVLIQ